jgi:hypothetical protein
MRKSVMHSRVFKFVSAAALLFIGVASLTPVAAQSPRICSYDEFGEPYNCHGTGLLPPSAPQPYHRSYQPQSYYPQPYAQPQAYYQPPIYQQPTYQQPAYQQPMYQQSSSCCGCNRGGLFSAVMASSSPCSYGSNYAPQYPQPPAQYSYPQHQEPYPEYSYPQYPSYPRYQAQRHPIRVVQRARPYGPARMNVRMRMPQPPMRRNCSTVRGRWMCR